MMTLAGKFPPFPAVPGQSTKDVAAGSALPGHAGMALWFSVMWPQRRVRAVPCLHLSRAGVDARVRFAAAVTRSLLPSAVIFRSFARSGFAASPCNSRQPCASGCASLAPLHPRLFARLLWRHGTARCRGICEQRRKHHAICETCHSER